MLNWLFEFFKTLGQLKCRVPVKRVNERRMTLYVNDPTSLFLSYFPFSWFHVRQLLMNIQNVMTMCFTLSDSVD
jgi:hypothetical protein